MFVPYTLPGEVVEVEPFPGHPDRRHLLRVETPSAERIAPVCPHFAVCGGCQTQHWDFARYLAWKRDLVVEALRQAGLDAPVAALIDAHGEGRRRAVFHARRSQHDVLEVGFAAYRAHHIVSIDRCPVLAPALDGAIPAAWALAEALGAMKKPLDIQVTATDAGLDVDVRGSGGLPPQRAAALVRLAETHRLARLTRHGELIAQRATPTVRIGKAHGRAAARRLPAGDRGRRGGAGAARRRACRQRQAGRRPVLRRRSVRAAPRRARPRGRGRCRRGRGRARSRRPRRRPG